MVKEVESSSYIRIEIYKDSKEENGLNKGEIYLVFKEENGLNKGEI